MSDGALANLRVLEIAHSPAASYCGKLLAGCGAEVIKVEPPGVGDPVRAYPPFPGDLPHLEKSGHFFHLNTGKKSVTLDLDTPKGVTIFKELVSRVDAVVEDTTPGVMEQRGLGPDALAEINSALVVTSVTPFGQTGPYAGLKTSELVTFALSGYMDLCGLPDREPNKAWGYLGEYVGGICAALATMSGLAARDQTGAGQHVDHAVMDSMLILLGMSPFQFHYLGQLDRRNGNDSPSVDHSHRMSTMLPCRDGYVQVSKGSEGRLSRLTGEPMLEESGHLREEYDAAFTPWLMEHDKAEIVSRAQEMRLAFTEVSEPAELFDDPQHEAREMFEEIDHPVAGRIKLPGAPFKMTGTPWQSSRAPLLGEHNEAIYSKELGYTGQEIARMMQMGVL